MGEEKERSLDYLGDLYLIDDIIYNCASARDKSDLKLKLIMEFSNAIFNTDTIEDLILLVYRTPACMHQCGISPILMSVMNEFGIDDQVYYARYVDLEDESDIADNHKRS